MNSKEALKKLIEGNERFANNKSIMPDTSQEKIKSLNNKQNPHAIIFTCSDSRVPPGIIFNIELGDTFVIRNAGHVVSKEVIASIDYALQSLGVKLVVVLAHSNCGAVKEVLNSTKDPDDENMQIIYDLIKPATKGYTIKDIEKATKQHAKNMAEILKEKCIKLDGVEIKVAYYSFDDGKVYFDFE